MPLYTGPALTGMQKQVLDLLAARTSSQLVGTYKDPYSYEGKLTADENPFEKLSQEQATTALTRPQAGWGDAVGKLLEGADTATTEKQFKEEYLPAQLRLFQEDILPAATEDYFSTTGARSGTGRGERFKDATVEFGERTGAALYQAMQGEKQRQQEIALQALPFAMEFERDPERRAALSAQFGELVRARAQDELDRLYTEWNRTHLDPLAAAQLVLGTTTHYAYGMASEEEEKGPGLLAGMLGGGAKGALAGAALGSVVPGIGTLAGGIVGGIGGAAMGSSGDF